MHMCTHATPHDHKVFSRPIKSKHWTVYSVQKANHVLHLYSDLMSQTPPCILANGKTVKRRAEFHKVHKGPGLAHGPSTSLPCYRPRGAHVKARSASLELRMTNAGTTPPLWSRLHPQRNTCPCEHRYHDTSVAPGGMAVTGLG